MEKIYETSEQQGHANPDIFSTIPKIVTFSFWQKLISFDTSDIDTSCGVVNITAPSKPDKITKNIEE